jgi:hypothetical protein
MCESALREQFHAENSKVKRIQMSELQLTPTKATLITNMALFVV